MAKSTLSRAIKLYGTEVPDGKRRLLTAGPIAATLDNGALRHITYRGVEVLRGISYLLRDRNWGTYSPVIEGLKVRQGKDGFTVTYTATARDKDQGLRYAARIEAKADGTVMFQATGTPLSDFLTNRTGFVVLHPLVGVAGQPVEIVHTDGKTEKSRFPRFISPGQPAFEIRSLKHTVMPGVTATVLMEGDKFEMEDHRNWMDASYKTYVCSLLDPWPYTLKRAKSFTQSITLGIAGKPVSTTSVKSSATVPVTLGAPKGRLPSIGVGVPMAEAKAALGSIALIDDACPDHLVCQIDGRENGQAEAAAMFRELKEKTGTPAFLEIILPAKDPAEDEMQAIAAQLRSADFKPDAVIVTQAHDLKSFQPGASRPWGPSYDDMARAARGAFPDVALGGGMLSYFTELNRQRPPQGLFDFITHTVCPIVHAADDVSVMETLEALPSIFASTRAMIGKAPYHLGPSGIACRSNPYSAAAASNPDNARICLSNTGPRQRGLFAAAWNLGLLAAAAGAGLDSVAVGAVTGPQGLIYRKAAHLQPWFDGAQAAVFPAYHVLAGLAPCSGQRRLDAASGAPSRVAALGCQSKTLQQLWLANLTSEAQKVKVTGFSGGARLHRLGDGNFQTLAMRPDYLMSGGESLKKVSVIELGPYGLARIASAS